MYVTAEPFKYSWGKLVLKCELNLCCLFVNRLAIPNPLIQGSLIVCARLCLQKGSDPSPSFRQVEHQIN